MAEIVGCFAVNHTPLLVLRKDRPSAEMKQKVAAEFERVARLLIDRGAEALIVFANDHLQAFFLDRFPALAVGIASRFRASPTEPWLPERNGGRPGDAALGAHLLQALLADGFDPAACHELRVDHSVVVPMHRLGDPPIPIVPILQNTVAPPLPPARRAFEVGRAVRRAVEAYRGVRRVGVVATGGLSHWIGTPEMGRVDEAWDRSVVDLCVQGRADALAQWSQHAIDAGGGNGGNEIRNWIAAAAAAGNTRAECRFYRPEPLWYVGVAFVEWPIA
jgi:hypothetical protein